MSGCAIGVLVRALASQTDSLLPHITAVAKNGDTVPGKKGGTKPTQAKIYIDQLQKCDIPVLHTSNIIQPIDNNQEKDIQFRTSR